MPKRGEDKMDKRDRKLFFDSKTEKDINKKLCDLTQIYQRNKDNYNVIFQLLKTLGSFSEYREKVKKIMPLLEKNYNPSAVYFEVGKMEMTDENYDSAIENFKTSLFFIDTNCGSILEMGKAYSAKGDKLSAKEKFLELASNYDDKAAYYELGVLKEEENDFYHASMYYKKVLELDQKDIRALFKLGEIEKRNENFETAKEYFSRIYDINKKDIYNLLELGRMEAELGNPAKAKEYYEEVLKMKEESAAYLELGILDEKSGNFNLAVEKYFKAIRCQNDKFAYFRLGCAFKQLKKFDEAKEYFSLINDAELAPVAVLEMVNILLKEEKIEEAQTLYNELLDSGLDKNIYERETKRVDAYIKYKLGVSDIDSDNEISSYIEQLTNYDEKNSIDNSKFHFEEDFDLEKTLKFVKNNLTEENFSNTRSGLDYYIIDCGYPIGNENGKETNKICVATVLNSEKIVYMIPAAKERLNLEEKKSVRIRK